MVLARTYVETRNVAKKMKHCSKYLNFLAKSVTCRRKGTNSINAFNGQYFVNNISKNLFYLNRIHPVVTLKQSDKTIYSEKTLHVSV